jgi:hypothetical protein
MINCSLTKGFTSYRFFVFRPRCVAAKNQFESYMTQGYNAIDGKSRTPTAKSLAGKTSRLIELSPSAGGRPVLY